MNLTRQVIGKLNLLT